MNGEKIRDMVLCAMFSALIAVGAFLKIPIPYVPGTLQVTFTTLGGYILGAKRGAVSVLIYIALGLAGVPVFTEAGGLSYILKPTFGYIIGFAIGAFVTGLIARKNNKPSYPRLLAAGLIGLAIVYFIGVVYFYVITKFYLGTDISVQTTLVHCFLLLVPKDIALTFVTALAAKRLIPIISDFENKRRSNRKKQCANNK